MTIVVTGGAGFIGSNFIFYWRRVRPGDRVVCLDKLTYAGHLKTLSPVLTQSWFRFVRLDICDRAGVSRVFEEERPDVVVNFAAESHVDRSIETPEVFLQTNVLGVQVLLDACRTYGVGRYHQVSTDEVYGDLPLDRPELSFTEEAPLRPSSPYSASKAAADLLALSYHRTFGLPVTVSRSSNNYGPYQFPEKLIPLTISRALCGQPIPIYGTGANIRDWLEVEDHCRAIALILQEGRPGEIYNVGSRCERSNLDVVRLICRELEARGNAAGCGSLEPLERLVTHVPDRLGHDLRYALDPGKLNALGFRPKVPFEAGLRQTVAWYLENRAWWEPLLQQNL